MLRVKNKAEEAEIYISGDIVDDEEGSFISEFWSNADGYEWPKGIREQLDAVKGKPLTIYINSYGGSVSAGLAMAHMIERHDAPTTAVVDAYCCSIATQIFFSADVCKMPSNSYLMLHKPSTFEYGNADDLRKSAEILDTIQRGLEEKYLQKLRDDKAEPVLQIDISAMVDNETWLTGTEAAEIFTIELMEPLKALNCVGSLDKLKSLHYQQIPEALKFKDDGKHIEAPPSILFEQQRKMREDQNKKIQIALARAKGAMV